MHRRRKLRDPVTFEHDGARIIGERGEPLAFALLAEDRCLLARSPKLHRPRGPYCLRGACDGCLARVDGVPNVMTCLVPARGGERVETQNVLGTRGVDLLRAADFLFPRGVDHHRLLAGVRGVSSVVQGFARRVAGLGRLPDRSAAARGARRLEVDALIVGGGASGLSAASALGARALLVDDGVELGGSLRALDPARAAALVDEGRSAGATLEASTTALGLYREPADPRRRVHALLRGPRGAELVTARAVIVASGAHEPVALFPNNDLPGIISARAALLLWHAGVVPGGRAGLLGDGRFARRFRELATAAGVEIVDIHPAALVRAAGRARLRSLWIRDRDRERKLELDALLVDGVGASSFELAVQAGARTAFDRERGYVPERDADGLVAPGVWCAGSAAEPRDPSASDGERVATAVVRALGR